MLVRLAAAAGPETVGLVAPEPTLAAAVKADGIAETSFLYIFLARYVNLTISVKSTEIDRNLLSGAAVLGRRARRGLWRRRGCGGGAAATPAAGA